MYHFVLIKLYLFLKPIFYLLFMNNFMKFERQIRFVWIYYFT